MRARLILAVGVAISLGGCQTLNGVVGSGEEMKAEVGAPTPPSPPVAPVAPSGGSLKGMAGEKLRALWGEPTLSRTDTGAEMWQYKSSGGCTLLVYVYGGTVTHAEALPGGADDAAVAACAKASGKPPLTPIS